MLRAVVHLRATTDKEESLIHAQSGCALEGTSDVCSGLRAVMEDKWPLNLVFMFRRDALRPANGIRLAFASGL